MAKKEQKITFKSLLNQLMERSLQSLISVVAQEAEHIIKWIKDLSGIGRKIRILLTTIILFAAGLGVLGIGIATYLSEELPNLSPGMAHILVGLFIILVAALNFKLRE